MSAADDPDDEGDLITFTVPPEAQGERLDRFLAAQADDLSRTRIKQLVLDGDVFVSGLPGAEGDHLQAVLDPSQKIKTGAVFHVVVPPPLDDTPVPENIPLEIVYEDDELLVLNKPVGMVVHPAPGHRSGTLVNALLHHCGDSLSGIGGVRRPGIVHRLDKDTSGLMMVAKTDRAHQGLSAQLADRTLARRYLALVWGGVTLRKGSVDAPIARHGANRQKMTVPARGGRAAVTHYERRAVYGVDAGRMAPVATLVECALQTGRTHQVRVHMAHIGFPLVGDPVYGAQRTAALSLLRKGGYEPEIVARIMDFPRQALHARALSFIHPVTAEEMSFEIPLPSDFADLISCFESVS